MQGVEVIFFCKAKLVVSLYGGKRRVNAHILTLSFLCEPVSVSLLASIYCAQDIKGQPGFREQDFPT